jgi:hypothetical protein
VAAASAPTPYARAVERTRTGTGAARASRSWPSTRGASRARRAPSRDGCGFSGTSASAAPSWRPRPCCTPTCARARVRGDRVTLQQLADLQGWVCPRSPWSEVPVPETERAVDVTSLPRTWHHSRDAGRARRRRWVPSCRGSRANSKRIGLMELGHAGAGPRHRLCKSASAPGASPRRSPESPRRRRSDGEETTNDPRCPSLRLKEVTSAAVRP